MWGTHYGRFRRLPSFPVQKQISCFELQILFFKFLCVNFNIWADRVCISFAFHFLSVPQQSPWICSFTSCRYSHSDFFFFSGTVEEFTRHWSKEMKVHMRKWWLSDQMILAGTYVLCQRAPYNLNLSEFYFQYLALPFDQCFTCNFKSRWTMEVYICQLQRNS